jgi:hypothetical protein
MLARTRNTLITVFVLAIAALVAYWYWSPFLALKQMQSAARAQDADAFNRHVDYPRLRDSLKGQMAARMAAELDQSGSAAGSLGTCWCGLKPSCARCRAASSDPGPNRLHRQTVVPLPRRMPP